MRWGGRRESFLVAANRSDRGPAPWFAAEAAARRVPLKRQCRRQFTDTCRVAGLPADWSRTADRDALGRSPRIVLVAANRSDRGSAPWFAAEAAARRVPLKRQCRRQFADTCRVAGLPAHSPEARADCAPQTTHWPVARRAGACTTGTSVRSEEH